MKQVKKVLVTGGAGFIGSHLVDRLIRQGITVTVIDNFDPYYNPEEKRQNLVKVINNNKFTLVEGDVRNRKILKGIVDEFIPDIVIHLAAQVGARNSLRYPRIYEEVNVLGTLNLLNVLKEKKHIHFVFASSSSVYGDNKKIPFAEKDSVDNQLSPYAVTKRSAELLCNMYAKAYHIPTVCLRFFSVFGPRQRPDLVIRTFIEKIIHNELIELYGPGDTARDYTYITDIVDGITACLGKSFDFEIINLGNSRPIKLSTLATLIENTLHKKSKRNYAPYQPADAKVTYADITKAKTLLGWSPKVTIENGLTNIRELYR